MQHASEPLPIVAADVCQISVWEIVALRRRKSTASQRTMRAIGAKALGSGAAALTGLMLVSDEKLVTEVVPSRLTSTVNAKPSVVSVVSAGVVPAGSENMLKANVVPEVDTPSGVLRAGPLRFKSNEIVLPKVNP